MTPEERKLYNKRYFQKNKEKRRDKATKSHRRWVKANKKHVTEYQKRYKKEHAEELKAYKKKYQMKQVFKDHQKEEE